MFWNGKVHAEHFPYIFAAKRERGALLNSRATAPLATLAATARSVVEARQFISLSVQHVFNSSVHVSLLPEIRRTPMSRPRFYIRW